MLWVMLLVVGGICLVFWVGFQIRAGVFEFVDLLFCGPALPIWVWYC